jgi:hypothetical protein
MLRVSQNEPPESDPTEKFRQTFFQALPIFSIFTSETFLTPRSIPLNPRHHCRVVRIGGVPGRGQASGSGQRFFIFFSSAL